jgi:alpha-L-rhamnosidase
MSDHDAEALISDQVRVAGLQVDCLNRPLGVESEAPRLSWRLESDRPGARQSAYRVRVASDPRTLATGGADVWDSGRVASDQSFDVAYAGPSLVSRQRCWWTVEVWDEMGAGASPAEPSWWEMGLLAASDWSAAWLNVETDEDRLDREAGLRWIWGEGDGLRRGFRRRFSLAQPARASIVIGARDQVTALAVDDADVALPPASPHAFGRSGAQRVDLGVVAAGEHTLAADVQVVARPNDSRPPRGAFGAMLKLTSDGGCIERIVTDESWTTGEDVEGGGALTSASAETNPRLGWPPTHALLMRTEFETAKSVVSARLYATALGAYEAFLNGRRIGDALLAPESTDFRKRALYRAYDVTDLLRDGPNVLGAHVGDGWYASVVAPGGRYAFGPAPRRFLAQLELTFADGTRQVVATGPGWRAAPSPVVESELYNGETYDARLERPGWSTPGFDASGWEAAQVGDPPPAQLSAHAAPPIRVTGSLEAAKITEVRPGVFVFDYGQNFAGLYRLKVKGAAGQRATLRFAEILGEGGEVDQANLRAARATDTYILRGDPAGETWTPTFTYHGFRYVQVEGYPGHPTADDLVGLVISSDLPITGELRVGDPLIQQIWKNALWSQRSNFTGIPTDCPQRDERLGWLGDACVFWDAAAFNMDVYGFTRRFAGDMRDAQSAHGGFSDFAPQAMRGPDEPAPGWADAGVVLPWTAWRRYGCSAIIDDHWDAMARYLGFLEAENPDHLWRKRRGFDFGDWLSLDAKQPGDPTTPKDLIGTAWWAHTAGLAAEMADASGRTAETARLQALRAKIVTAFQGAFIDAGGMVGNGSQTSYILALKFGLVPDALRAAAAKGLTDDIERRGGVLSTGFLGTPFSLDVLADIGRPDLVYDLLLRTEFPSWGYMIRKGATTIWERWNGDVGDVAMNSYNHYALGAVAGFLFRRVAGIEPAAPGFREILVKPVLDPRVTKAGADYDSVLGRISTDWTWSPGERFDLTLTVPPGAIARIELPEALGAVSVDGRQTTGEVRVASGHHQIIARS